MRKSTFLWLLLAVFCSGSLFYTSQKIHDSREKMTSLSRAVAREQESIRVLQAEWSYLNQPQRLEKLAGQYLNLAPMKGAQFIRPEGLQPRGPSGGEVAAVVPGIALAGAVPGIRINPPASRTAKIKPRAAPQHAVASATENSRSFSDMIRGLGAE